MEDHPRPYTICAISDIELRKKFNDGAYWARAHQREFRQVVLKDRHPALPLACEPICTRSQIVAYQDAGGKRIALVHQYLREDGTLGASGQPDPKRLLVEGILYVVIEPERR